MDQEQETYVNVLLVLDSRRRVLVGEAELLLHAAALEELQTGDPLRAGMFGWVERLLVEGRLDARAGFCRRRAPTWPERLRRSFRGSSG